MTGYAAHVRLVQNITNRRPKPAKSSELLNSLLQNQGKPS